MMMPANFSAIAESEMTYVVGGGLIDALGAVTAPIWNADNVKTFNTNMIQIVGNTFVPNFVKGTLGVMFSGKYFEKNGKNADGDDIRNTVFGKDSTMGLWTTLDPNGDAETNGFNKFMMGLGALAAVYTLGTAATVNAVGDSPVKFTTYTKFTAPQA